MTKILLVEDDKSLREIYGVRLLAEGYDIVSAGDGEEALAMAIKDRPALIVSDVMMPKISGFDMLDILRSTTETRDIKVIMMTALSSEDQRKRGESLGADRYLVKSQVGIEDVVRAVHEVLGDAPNAAPATPATVTPDMPVAPISQPAPQAAPPVSIPPRDTAPVSAPMPATPTAPAPAPVSPEPAQAPVIPVPTVPPIAPTAPTAPAAEPPASLPQPTAPFSTPRPAGLGDRIIQPISDPSANNDDVANRMAQELSALTDATVIPASEPATDTSSPAPSPTTPVAVPAPVPSTSGLPPVPEPPKFDFEETPRPPAPGTPVPPPTL